METENKKGKNVAPRSSVRPRKTMEQKQELSSGQIHPETQHRNRKF